MKSATLVWGLGLCLGLSTPAMAWETQAIGAPHPIRTVQFSGSDTGFAVGDSGMILKTTNGGSNWTAQSIGTTRNINVINVLNPRIAWIMDDGGSIYRTTNGGQQWLFQSADTNFINRYASSLSLSFVNQDTGWASANGWQPNPLCCPTFVIKAFKTVNGGVTWDSVFGAANYTPGTIRYFVRFQDVNTGWLLGGSVFSTGMQGPIRHVVMARTTNGGLTWEDKGAVAEPFSSAYFLNKDTAWAVSGNAYTYDPSGGPAYTHLNSWIYKTVNGGADWTTQLSLSGILNSISFHGKDTGLAVGDSGLMLITHDGGATWIHQSKSTTGALSSAQIISSTLAFTTMNNDSLYKGNPSISVVAVRKSPQKQISRRNLNLSGNILSYRLSTPNPVSITLLDPQGREVMKLKNRNEAAGSHQINLPQNGIVPGKYILDFRAGTIHETLMIQGP